MRKENHRKINSAIPHYLTLLIFWRLYHHQYNKHFLHMNLKTCCPIFLNKVSLKTNHIKINYVDTHNKPITSACSVTATAR